MTRNQIDYWRLQEDKRHNRAVEKETERANRVASTDRRIATDLDYRVRSQANVINRFHLEQQRIETTRHNRATEGETYRHNYATEQLQASSQEIEKSRIQLGYDQIANQMSIAQLQSATSLKVANINASVGYAQVAATREMTAENRRANQAREAEQHRSNLAQENIARQNASTASINASTQARKQNLEESKWKAVGYDQATAELTRTRAQTTSSWAQTDAYKAQAEYSSAQAKLAPVNSVSNLIGSGAQVVRAIKGGTLSERKPQVQWPDGSVSY